MIYFISTASHSYTMGLYLMGWGASLEPRIELLSYERLFAMRGYAAGTYIFSDFDRLTSRQRVTAGAIADSLISARMRVLNHPVHSLRRFDVLRMLFDSGINAFNVYRLTTVPISCRFPVILRPEGEHQVATDLLHTFSELYDAATEFEARGYSRTDLVVTEYCDTSDPDGVYRRHCVLIVGDQILPRGVNFSYSWVQRDYDLIAAARLAEERAYARTFPHKALLQEILRDTGIHYGRVDFGLLNDIPQIWEVNVNPTLLMSPDHYHPTLLPMLQRYADQLLQAFLRLDSDGPCGFSVAAPRVT